MLDFSNQNQLRSRYTKIVKDVLVVVRGNIIYCKQLFSNNAQILIIVKYNF